MVKGEAQTQEQGGIGSRLVQWYRRAVRSDEGAADVSAQFEEVGLSSRMSWLTAGVLFTVGGGSVAAYEFVKPETLGTLVVAGAYAAVALGTFCFVGASKLRDSDKAIHFRLIAGLSLLFAGAFTAGDARVAFPMMFMSITFSPAFLYGLRWSVPYSLYTIAFTIVIVGVTPGPARVAHAYLTASVLAMLVVGFNVAAQRSRNLARRNRALAYSDPLTGIANTRHLRDELARRLALAKDSADERFALFALDLDNFKQVNDVFDHSTGDAVLCAVAAEISGELEPGDLVARRGGDEFSVVIARAGERDLDALWERVSLAICRARLRTCPDVSPSGSVAYVVARPDDTVPRLLRRADDALHEAKLQFHHMHGRRDGSNVASAPHDGTAQQASPTDIASAECRRRDPVWSFAAAIFASLAFAVAVTGATGLLDPLPIAKGTLLAAAIATVAAISWVGARRGWALRYLHLAMLANAGALLALNLWAGPAAAAAADLLIVPALYGFFFFGPGAASIHMFVNLAAYTLVLLSNSVAYAPLRLAVGCVTVLTASGLIARIRAVTVRFAVTNRELSERDPLTGLANLRALRLRARTAIDAAGESQTPVLIAIDLDDFKSVNDLHSHTTGDQVLEAVAKAISESLRPGDLAARRGGDEFLVLCEGLAEHEAAMIAGRISEAIAYARHRVCPDITATASVAAVMWHDGVGLDEFIHDADLALHAEKLKTRASTSARAA